MNEALIYVGIGMLWMGGFLALTRVEAQGFGETLSVVLCWPAYVVAVIVLVLARGQIGAGGRR